MPREGSSEGMTTYIIRRLLLMIPTLLAIMVINFIVIQAAPGGPVEQIIAEIQGHGVDATARISGAGNETNAGDSSATTTDGGSGGYRGARGLEAEQIKEIEKLFGFDKPAHERFLQMLGNYLRFDFGDSFFRDRAVVDLVIDKLPVSISLGLWTTLLTYLICIPLGITKAVRDGTGFDVWTSGVIIVGYAIPGFLFCGTAGGVLRGRKLSRLVSVARTGFRELRRAESLGQGGGLFLAPGVTPDSIDDRELRHADHAHQEFLPG